MAAGSIRSIREKDDVKFVKTKGQGRHRDMQTEQGDQKKGQGRYRDVQTEQGEKLKGKDRHTQKGLQSTGRQKDKGKGEDGAKKKPAKGGTTKGQQMKGKGRDRDEGADRGADLSALQLGQGMLRALQTDDPVTSMSSTTTQVVSPARTRVSKSLAKAAEGSLAIKEFIRK